MPLTRSTRNFVFKMETGQQISEPVDLSQFAWGSIELPPSLDGLTIDYLVSVGGGFVAAADTEGAALAPITFAPGLILALPQEIMSACSFRVRASAPQTAEREFRVNLKG